MGLFSKGNRSRKRQYPFQKKRSILSRIKGAFHRSKSQPDSSDVSLAHKLGIMFARSMIVLVIGVAWFVLAPWLFLVLLPSFSLYNSRIVASGTDIYSVYQFWQILPLVLLFMFAPFWTSGLLEMIFHHQPLRKVF